MYPLLRPGVGPGVHHPNRIDYTRRVESAIETVLAALNEAKVRYLVVGGVAMVLHGHRRLTADLDLVIQLHEDNSRRAMDALTTLGYVPRAPVAALEFADTSARESWIKDKGLTVFSLTSDRFRDAPVDLFVREPFDFDAAYARSAHVPLHGTVATVASLADLLELKVKTGRPQDLADAEVLRQILSRRSA